MPPTIKELAQELNLSISTVSRILGGKSNHLFNPATRDRVLVAAQKKHFIPPPVAKALVTGKTNTIGVLTYSLCPSYYNQTLMLFNEIIYGSKYHMQIFETRNRVLANEELGQLAAWRVDGILAFDSPATIASFRSAGLSAPVVCLGTARYDGVDRDQVWVDARAATREALERMATQPGVRRLAMVTSEWDPAETRRDFRVEVYRETAARHGLAEEYIKVPDWDRPGDDGFRGSLLLRKAQARRAVADHVARLGAPDAIFAQTDDIAVGALRGLLDRGLRVPRDVLLMGFDGTDDVDYCYVDLSTVAIPTEAMCRTAWTFLRRRMEDRDGAPESVVLQAEPLIRSSSLRPADAAR